KPYVQGDIEPLPLEVLLGVSKKFRHMPLRLNATFRHTGRDLTYVDPNDPSNYDALTGDYTPKNYTFFQKFERHMILGAELLLSKNFHVRASYNFQRRMEMLVDTRPRTVGLSFGFGIKISKFILGYGRASYHLAGASNHFSISTNLAEF